MNGNNESRFLGVLLSAIGLAERRGGSERRAVVSPVRRPSRKSLIRRAKRAARQQAAAGVECDCPVDWRNPLMIGNRRERAKAERSGR